MATTQSDPTPAQIEAAPDEREAARRLIAHTIGVVSDAAGWQGRVAGVSELADPIADLLIAAGFRRSQPAPRTVSAAVDRLSALGSEITPEMEGQPHRVLWVNLRTDLREAVTDLRAALDITVEAS